MPNYVANLNGGVLTGSNQDDTITGSAAADDLRGQGGNDVIYGSGGGDAIDGGDGTDTVDYSASSAAVTVNLSLGTGFGGDAEGDKLVSIENLVGSKFDDKLTGDTGANTILAGAGNDVALTRRGARMLCCEFRSNGRLSVPPRT